MLDSVLQGLTDVLRALGLQLVSARDSGVALPPYAPPWTKTAAQMQWVSQSLGAEFGSTLSQFQSLALAQQQAEESSLCIVFGCFAQTGNMGSLTEPRPLVVRCLQSVLQRRDSTLRAGVQAKLASPATWFNGQTFGYDFLPFLTKLLAEFANYKGRELGREDQSVTIHSLSVALGTALKAAASTGSTATGFGGLFLYFSDALASLQRQQSTQAGQIYFDRLLTLDQVFKQDMVSFIMYTMQLFEIRLVSRLPSAAEAAAQRTVGRSLRSNAIGLSEDEDGEAGAATEWDSWSLQEEINLFEIMCAGVGIRAPSPLSAQLSAQRTPRACFICGATSHLMSGCAVLKLCADKQLDVGSVLRAALERLGVVVPPVTRAAGQTSLGATSAAVDVRLPSSDDDEFALFSSVAAATAELDAAAAASCAAAAARCAAARGDDAVPEIRFPFQDVPDCKKVVRFADDLPLQVDVDPVSTRRAGPPKPAVTAAARRSRDKDVLQKEGELPPEPQGSGPQGRGRTTIPKSFPLVSFDDPVAAPATSLPSSAHSQAMDGTSPLTHAQTEQELRLQTRTLQTIQRALTEGVIPGLGAVLEYVTLHPPPTAASANAIATNFREPFHVPISDVQVSSEAGNNVPCRLGVMLDSGSGGTFVRQSWVSDSGLRPEQLDIGGLMVNGVGKGRTFTGKGVNIGIDLNNSGRVDLGASILPDSAMPAATDVLLGMDLLTKLGAKVCWTSADGRSHYLPLHSPGALRDVSSTACSVSGLWFLLGAEAPRGALLGSLGLPSHG